MVVSDLHKELQDVIYLIYTDEIYDLNQNDI